MNKPASPAPGMTIEVTTITPDQAMKMVENNSNNRPLRQSHVNRIAALIRGGRWRLNGDTIKFSASGNILDGQHRLWGIIEAGIAVETAIAHNVTDDAFATVDSIRVGRNAADILSLAGVKEHRRESAVAICWLARWQKGALRGPDSRIENHEVQELFANHPHIVDAVAAASKAVRGIASPGVFGFLYYIMASRDAGIAGRMIDTLADPSSCPINDPFFKLRQHLVHPLEKKRRDPVIHIALAIKAANLVRKGKGCDLLKWRNQGEGAEAFPTLDF